VLLVFRFCFSFFSFFVFVLQFRQPTKKGCPIEMTAKAQGAGFLIKVHPQFFSLPQKVRLIIGYKHKYIPHF